MNLSDHRGEGVAMYPVKRFEQMSPMVSVAQNAARGRPASKRIHVRMHTCAAALIAADLVAFGGTRSSLLRQAWRHRRSHTRAQSRISRN
jgi:hypothetical protein